MTNMWMVRAGKNAFLIDEFKENNIVAIGWGLGNLKDKSKEEIEELVYEKYPNKTKNQNTIIVAQEYKFLKDIKKGDYVTIIGHNGSGKSTLAKLIAGLLPVKQGEIVIDGLTVKKNSCLKYI